MKCQNVCNAIILLWFPQRTSFLYEIVSNGINGIDVDKFDYFARWSLIYSRMSSILIYSEELQGVISPELLQHSLSMFCMFKGVLLRCPIFC